MQNTIATSISGKGVGRARSTIHFSITPAPINSGIKVIRTDISPVEVFNSNDVLDSHPWLTSHIFDLQSLKPLLAVLRIFGIDNSVIEIGGDELPAMGDNSELFLFLVRSAGRRKQFAPKRSIKLLQSIVVAEGGGWIRMIPSSRFRIACLNSSFQKSFPVYNFGAMVEFSQTLFISELCRARPLNVIKNQWSVVAKENIPADTLRNKKQKLIGEINQRELLESVNEIAAFGINPSLDYVSFNADDRLRNKLVSVLVENASLYLSVQNEDSQGTEKTAFFPAGHSFSVGLIAAGC